MENVGLLRLTNLEDQGQRGTSTPVYGGVDVAPDFRFTVPVLIGGSYLPSSEHNLDKSTA